MTDRCEVCGAPEEHFDAAPCVEYLKRYIAELERRLECITALVDGELPRETHAAATYITIRKVATGEEVIGRRD